MPAHNFFHKFLECCSVWLTLDGEHCNAAWRSLDFVNENVKNLKAGCIEYANFSLDRACYLALTNIKQSQAGCQCKKRRTQGSWSFDIEEREALAFSPCKFCRSVKRRSHSRFSPCNFSCFLCLAQQNGVKI